MSKDVTSFELTLGECPAGITLARWLHAELTEAILQGRLASGVRLPASRDFASQYGVSRGTVVSVFEQLQAEGYLRSQVGAGTWVNKRIPERMSGRGKASTVPAKIRPEPMVGLLSSGTAQPFRLQEPALDQFPVKVWARVARTRLRRFSSWLGVQDDGRGFQPLRDALADYLGTSRGVKCSSDQIVLVSGVQQALDLLGRLLLKPGDPVWVEDPGYFGAVLAFQNAGAKVISVPVDEDGLSVAEGRRLEGRAKAVYLTPAHQFPLGVTMSLERRLDILKWASETGAFIIEDDYDSEYRFVGRPIAALQGMDNGSRVIFVGTLNKLLFPSLRVGYIVLPQSLIEPYLAFRFGTDLRSATFDQAVLCDFMVDGHLGRHIRRMRDLYAGRLTALLDGGERYLKGLVEISNVRAGLYTAAFLRNGMTSRQAETAAADHGIESMGMHRFTLRRPDPRGLLLGFAAFDEGRIRSGLSRLATALEIKTQSH